MKSFENWEFEEVLEKFGLSLVREHPLLMEWLTAQEEILLEERTQVSFLQKRLQQNVEFWNEDELKFLFISPFISLINYETEQYKVFTQRNLSAKIGDIEIGGKVDFMVATGIQHPHQPFLFLHEYKQERRREHDPHGQLLISMVAAQAKNKGEFPLYGAYIIGRHWYFMVLTGKEHAISDSFTSSKDDIFQIFMILKRAKKYIDRYFQNP